VSDCQASDVAKPSQPTERRRYERLAVNGISANLTAVVDAEILDISVSGALVKCRYPLRVADRALLRTVLQREPLVTEVAVVRVVACSGRASPGICAGVAFINQDDESTGLLRRFLKPE
jgi:PilZ domain